MKLFNELSHDLRFFHEPLDRTRGTYAHIPRIAEAQARLYDEILGTDQVIWCSLDKPPHCDIGKPCFLHVIEEDESDRLAVLDGMVWEWIIGQNCIPDAESERICNVTNHLEQADRNRVREEMKAEFAEENLPRDLWGNLRTDEITCRMPQVLLRWPLVRSTILDVIPG